MRAKAGCLLIATVAALALSGPALAQTTGTLRGFVADPEGVPLPGVAVTVRSDALIGRSRSMITGANGTFNFPGLPPGVYSVTTELSGFRSVTLEEVRVSINQTTTVNLRLELAAVEETITVTGESPMVDVASAGVATNFDAEFIEDLPTARNFYDLIQTAPGMSNSWKPGTSDRTVAFGSNQQSNIWHVDGLNLTAPETGSSWMDVNPDAIEEIQVIGVGLPAEFGNATGGAFNIVTKRGGNEFHGTGSFFWQHDALTDTNVALEDTEFPSFHRELYREVTGTLGGPLARDRVWFFLSGRYKRDGYTEPRLDPAFTPINKSDILDVKITARLSERHYIDGTAHIDNWDFPYDISAFQTPDAFSGERGKTPGWSANYRGILSDATYLELKYGGWWADDIRDSATGSLKPAFVDFTPPGGGPMTISDGVWWPWTYVTWHQQFQGNVSHFADDFIKGDHDFKFGVQYSYGTYDTKVAAGPTGTYYAHYYGYYYQVVQMPYTYGGRNRHVGGFIDDAWTVSDRLTLNLGVRFDNNVGRIPDYPRLTGEGFPDWRATDEVVAGRKVLDWKTASPRLGFALIPSEGGRMVIRGHFGVYYDGNVGGNWDAPTVNPPPYQWWWLPNWPGLAGRELVFEFLGTDRGFDPDLKNPVTYQTSVGFEQEVGRDYAFGAQYVYKSGKDLVGWNIVGGVWEEVPFVDPFTGQQYTLWSMVEVPLIRKSNGPGNVNNPDIAGKNYWQKYHGFIVTFKKRWSNNWSMQASYTLSKSWGLIPRMLANAQFNPFYGSKEGSDPNNYINAEQRLQGDRPHMFRVLGNLLLPGDVEITGVVSLQSGRPFNRQIRVGGLGQGTVRVIMTPAGEVDPVFGRLRYPFEKRVDVAVGKRIAVGRGTLIKLDAQVFNLFNDDAHTLMESLVLQAGDTFIPTDYMWPRRLMVRLGLEF